jgi:hypothetical protein
MAISGEVVFGDFTRWGDLVHGDAVGSPLLGMTQQRDRSTGDLAPMVNGLFVGAGSLYLATGSLAVTVLVTLIAVLAVVVMRGGRGRE